MLLYSEHICYLSVKFIIHSGAPWQKSVTRYIQKANLSQHLTVRIANKYVHEYTVNSCVQNQTLLMSAKITQTGSHVLKMCMGSQT